VRSSDADSRRTRIAPRARGAAPGRPAVTSVAAARVGDDAARVALVGPEPPDDAAIRGALADSCVALASIERAPSLVAATVAADALDAALAALHERFVVAAETSLEPAR